MYVNKVKYIILAFLFLVKTNFLMGIEAGCCSLRNTKIGNKPNQDASGFFRHENKLFFYVFDGHDIGGEILVRRLVDCLKESVYNPLPRHRFAEGETLLRCIQERLSEIPTKEARGSCGLYGYVERDYDKYNVHLANVGDCQAGMFDDQGWKFTYMHRANCNEEENERIRKKGGHTTFSGRAGRLESGEVVSLGMTRVYGDPAYREVGVIDEPTYYYWTAKGDSNFFVLGSDGFWETWLSVHVPIENIMSYKDWLIVKAASEDCSTEAIFNFLEEEFDPQKTFNIDLVCRYLCKTAAGQCRPEQPRDDTSIVVVCFDGDGQDSGHAGCTVDYMADDGGCEEAAAAGSDSE